MYNPLDYLGGAQKRHLDLFADHHFPRTLEDVLRDQQRDHNRICYRDRPQEPTNGTFSPVLSSNMRTRLRASKFSFDHRLICGRLMGNAVVKVICNASNLTVPEILEIPKRSRCEQSSTYKSVRGLRPKTICCYRATMEIKYFLAHQGDQFLQDGA